MKALVEAGADVTLAAEGGVTPLHAAAELGALDLVQLLLKVLPVGCAAVCLSFSLTSAFQVIPFACLVTQHLPVGHAALCTYLAHLCPCVMSVASSLCQLLT